MARKSVPRETETRVLTVSGRRCCLCYGLLSDFDTKHGQIAHLDQNPENNSFDNLAFFCLPHHDEYDSRPSQSKGLTIAEVKDYRDMLYRDLDARRRAVREDLVTASAARHELAAAKPRLRTSYRPLRPPEDYSYADIKRLSVAVEVPLGRSEEEVKKTLERAALEIAERQTPNALMVLGYRPGDDGKGIYTAGRAILAPNGRWGDAAKEAQTGIAVDVARAYFAPQATLCPGDEAILLPSPGGTVDLSRERDDWTEENIVLRVERRTPAKVLKRHEEALTPDRLFIRYLVQVTNGKRDVKGWVHDWDVKPVEG